MGAKLHPSPKTYRVYAPSTHSLPVIKCVSGIEGYAEIELKSCSSNLSRLKDLSPHYSRIWNSTKTIGDSATLGGASFQRSFSIVSVIDHYHKDRSMLTYPSFIPRRTMLSIDRCDHFIWRKSGVPP